MNNLLVVYGTLRKGHGNHYLMEDCAPVAEGATVKATLYLSGLLPMIFEGEDTVLGEIYEIPSLEKWKRLDALEGHPDWYERREVDATNPKDGSTVKVWVYFMKGESYEGLHRSPTGDYNTDAMGNRIRERRRD